MKELFERPERCDPQLENDWSSASASPLGAGKSLWRTVPWRELLLSTDWVPISALAAVCILMRDSPYGPSHTNYPDCFACEPLRGG